MADKLISAAKFAGGESVQAFPLGGRAVYTNISHELPGPLTPEMFPPSPETQLSAKASAILFRVPAGRTLYVGNAAQMAPHIAAAGAPEALRTLMFPLPAGLYVFSLVDADQDELVVMADGSDPFPLYMLEAATLGPENP